MEQKQMEQTEQISNDNPFQEKQSQTKLTNINLVLIVSIVLIVGIGIGFFVQPLLVKDTPSEIVATANNQNSSSASVDTGAGDASPTPTIMELVLSDARHFQGSEDAPVTMIEFSDFK